MATLHTNLVFNYSFLKYELIILLILLKDWTEFASCQFLARFVDFVCLYNTLPILCKIKKINVVILQLPLSRQLLPIYRCQIEQLSIYGWCCHLPAYIKLSVFILLSACSSSPAGAGTNRYWQKYNQATQSVNLKPVLLLIQ